jgi:hypothetical protein
MAMAISVATFLWNPMGNSIEAYRSAIDMFYNCSRISCTCVLVQTDSHRNILLTNIRCSLLFVSLLVLPTAKCWTKFVLFLILCILILHKEMELSLALLSKLGSIGQFPDHDLVRHYRSLKWSEKQIKERKYLHLGLNSGVQGGTRTIKNTVKQNKFRPAFCSWIRYSSNNWITPWYKQYSVWRYWIIFLHKNYPTPWQTESHGRGASDLYERKCKHFKDNPIRE